MARLAAGRRLTDIWIVWVVQNLARGNVNVNAIRVLCELHQYFVIAIHIVCECYVNYISTLPLPYI